jgi:hypothetical protein
MEIAWRVAKFCNAAQALFDVPLCSQDLAYVLSLLKIAKFGIDIENRCGDWSDETLKKPVWGYKVCRVEEGRRKYPPHIYYDTYIAFVWNFFRACRIRLHEVLLRCITLIHSSHLSPSLCIDPEITGKESKDVIKEMIFDICCSAYFCLGQIDENGDRRDSKPMPHLGYQTLWPFYVAMVSANEADGRKEWLKVKLEIIERAMGIKLAGMLARRENTEAWDIR